MTANKNNSNEPEPARPDPLPSTGEGADSALDVLRKKRGETPARDASLPLQPPRED